MNFLNKQLIILIFILGLISRLANFGENNVPPSLNWDEVSLGYNAYSILKTGADEWGRPVPLTFEAFGDYKLPGYIYTLVPFISVFGLNEFSVRMPSILFGSISVIFLYLLVFNITKDKKWSIIASLLLAISPWHFFLSRIALEANLALSFFIIGLYFLTLGLKKSIYFVLSSLIFGLAIFTYNSARIFVPLFLLAFVLIYWKQIKVNIITLISALMFGIFLAVGFYLALFQDSSARYYWVRILDEGAIAYLDQARNLSTLPDLITKLIYNKPFYFAWNFILNYIKHLSPVFLTLSGGSNYQFSLQNFGLIYFVELPFLIFGSIKLARSRLGLLFIAWLLIAPIPSALTREAPHALRSIFMIGALQIITAFGVINFLTLIKKRIFLRVAIGLISIFIIFNLTVYLKNYFLIYPQQYSKSWQYGYKQAIEILIQNYDKYPKIYFTKQYGEPHIFYLFFSKYDPENYQRNETLLRTSHTNWRWVDRLDKIYFLNDWELLDKLKDESGALVITSPESVPENSRHIETIYFLDGSKAFEIVEI